MFDNLSLHTKVRRLGYIKLLVEQYFTRDFIPVNSFNQYFERVASTIEVRKQLENYDFYYRKDNKGVIEPLGSGSSSEPYLRLAESLTIIAKNNYSYILTKYGKVYKTILERYQRESDKFKYIEEQRVVQPIALFDLNIGNGNVFVLNALDKFFFLKLLLSKDFFYLKTILVLIKNNLKQESNTEAYGKYAIIKQNFLNELVQQIKVVQSLPYLSPELRDKAYEFAAEVTKKRLKPRSYESIIEPRINWLLDLDLIDASKHKLGALRLSESGKILLENILNVTDVYKFFENDFVKTFAAIYRLKPKLEFQIDKKFDKYLNYAFINFKTLAPNRIAVSQAIEYIVIMSLLRDGVIIEYDVAKKYLLGLDGKGYIIDWFPSENDGSIKKMK